MIALLVTPAAAAGLADGRARTGGEVVSSTALTGQPPGTATADETKFSGCGGFTVLPASVKNVNLPNGTQIWVTIDFKAVGLITLSRGSGSMTPYNLGRFGVLMDAVRISSSLPDVGAFQQSSSAGVSHDLVVRQPGTPP